MLEVLLARDAVLAGVRALDFSCDGADMAVVKTSSSTLQCLLPRCACPLLSAFSLSLFFLHVCV